MCDCKSFLPPTPQAAEALRLLDDPLVLEAKRALGIIAPEPEPVAPEPPTAPRHKAILDSRVRQAVESKTP